jgi:cytochrome c-type biogenesis protein CcmF
LAGVCPLIAWRKASTRNLIRNFSYPLMWSFVVTAVLYLSGVRHVIALISLSICGFVLGTIVFEFYRGTRARQSSQGGSTWHALISLVQRNRRRYGGYIVHLGVVLAFVGITGSSAYQIEKDIVLRPGERADVGTFTLQYDRLDPLVMPTYEGFIATVRVFRGDDLLSTLKPEKRIYFAQEQPTTEVALRTSLFEDLYVILAGFEPSRLATFRVFINPLVAWLWIGGLVMVVGTIIAIWPERRLPQPARRQADTAVSAATPGDTA